MGIPRMSTLCVLAMAGAAAAQPCEPGWSTEFVLNSPDESVQSIASIDLGQGPSLFVGGMFPTVASAAISGIAEYRNGIWQPVGGGIPAPYNSHGFLDCCTMVRSIIPSVVGGKPRLYVGGDFIMAGGVEVESVAQFRNGAWSDLAGGMAILGCQDCPARVYSMLSFDDGSGLRMFAGGSFQVAGGVEARGIATWNGTSWAPVGGGLGNSEPIPDFLAWVESMVVFNNQLYVAGSFGKIGDVETLCIARWNGLAWEDVGGGFTIPPGGATPAVKALLVHDDGTGPALYAGGSFSVVGGRSARNIAKWDGESWSGIGAGVGSDVNAQVLTMASFDDGTGPALYVGGDFEDAGGLQARCLAKWDGASWSEFGRGVRGYNVPGLRPSVQTMAVHNDGTGKALYVGGWFERLGDDILSANFGKWTGCESCYANCDGSGGSPILTANDFQCFLNRYAAQASYANCDGSTGTPELTANDFQCFLNQFAAGCGQ